VVFNDDLNIDQIKTITFEGGYDCDYTSITGETIINGNLIITEGIFSINNGKLVIGEFP
jgi:hypothetical protein